MNDRSIFLDRTATPTEEALADKLDTNYERWKHIRDLVMDKYPDVLAEWNYPGEKFGWSFRIKDKKRVLVYLLPRDRYFKVAFVFGDKAVNRIMESGIANDIKVEISQARKYAEGRGVRLDVRDDSRMSDIEQLIDIKLNP